MNLTRSAQNRCRRHTSKSLHFQWRDAFDRYLEFLTSYRIGLWVLTLEAGILENHLWLFKDAITTIRATSSPIHGITFHYHGVFHCKLGSFYINFFQSLKVSQHKPKGGNSHQEKWRVHHFQRLNTQRKLPLGKPDFFSMMWPTVKKARERIYRLLGFKRVS